MEKIIQVGRSFYGIALVVYGIQQFVYADFRPVFVPAWQSFLPGLFLWAYIFGIGLIAAGFAVIVEKKGREVSLILGSILLALFCFVHVPYELISDPYSKHLALWTNALKELALAGGAFVMAGSFYKETKKAQKNSVLLSTAEKVIPFGKVFFSITMMSFGIVHFLYAETVAKLVPGWIPFPLFWTYLAGVLLIGSGAAICLSIKTKQIAVLLGLSIFLWLLLLHIPRAIATPFTDRGNEVSSAFDALAFSGIAFVIALSGTKKEE